MFSKIKKYLIDIGIEKNIPDDVYLKKIFKEKMNKELDLNNPKSFNEKLQWLKINNRKDIYTSMVDKYEAKQYVSNIIGEEYIIPTLSIWNKFDEIDFNSLPDKFVLKTTHDSGSVYICKDKKNLNKLKLKIKFNLTMKENFYYRYREWPYKNLKPRIIAEEYLEYKNEDLCDFKFWCFNGKPILCLVCSDRQNDLKETFFDMEWNILDIKRPNHEIDRTIKKPLNFELMKLLASKLSESQPFIRVDFYEVNGKVYFGELTFFPGGGMVQFVPESWDYKLGEFIDLDKFRNEVKNG